LSLWRDFLVIAGRWLKEMDGIYYRNRKDAGEKLAKALEKFRSENPLVVGIPRGGVEVAYYVAAHLGAELSILVSKKLSWPGQEEYGFGGICEESILYFPDGQQMPGAEVVAAIIADREEEIERRVILYRGGEPLPEMNGRTVILVDDGIATGVTLVPAIRLCRKKEAKRVVVGAPVSGRNFDEGINEADEVVVPHREMRFGVGEAYLDFRQVSDQEVISLLEQAREIKKRA
jgi:putative phosphoribosyl transferase